MKKSLLRKTKSKLLEPVEYLIMSVGMSYEPLVLSIKLCKPRKILFLYTQITESVLNKIVKYCDLDMTRFQKVKVHETSPIDMYREIKQAYLMWKRPKKLFIDFTGGTKAMSAAAAMAGSVIDVQMIYVGCTEYLVDFRKPYPGSETIYFIENPLEIFGDFEIEKAMVLFHEADFSGAREKLEVLKDRIPDPNLRQQLSFVYLLAKMYEHWDSLEFPEAYEVIVQLNKELWRDSKLHGTFILMNYIPRLKYQESVLEALKEIPGLIKEKKNYRVLNNLTYIRPLMFTMYTNALLREEQEKYDMATLLLYRLLEMIEQRRLSLYGIYVSKADYTKYRFRSPVQIKMNDLAPYDKKEWLKDAVYEIKCKLFPRVENKYLPEQISLLEGFIILLALRDEITQVPHDKHIEKLKRIRSMVFLRNNSIFAHGLGPVQKEDYLKFKSFVHNIFQEFCTIEKINFKKQLDAIHWLNPVESEYYSKLEV